MSPSWASAGSARCACSSSCTPRRLRVPSTPPRACQPAHCAAATLHTRPQLRRLPRLTHSHSLLRAYAVRRFVNLVSNHTRRGALEDDAVSLERDRRHLRQRQPERSTSRRACSATSSRARHLRHRILRLHPDRHSRAVARRCCRTTAARPCTKASAATTPSRSTPATSPASVRRRAAFVVHRCARRADRHWQLAIHAHECHMPCCTRVGCIISCELRWKVANSLRLK